MGWTTSIAPEAAGPELSALYQRIAANARDGRVAALWQALAADPRGLAAFYDQYRAVMAEPAPLTAAQAEMIAIVVSATNGCGYCVAHRGPRLAALAGDDLARAVAADYRTANLTARDRVLLDAAVALTCEPSERTREDVERLREYGFDDAHIVKAAQVAAFYNQANRLVAMLGVELEANREAWRFGQQC